MRMYTFALRVIDRVFLYLPVCACTYVCEAAIDIHRLTTIMGQHIFTAEITSTMTGDCCDRAFWAQTSTIPAENRKGQS